MSGILMRGIDSAINALGFVGFSSLFSGLHESAAAAERKRHDLAMEKFQKDEAGWMRKRQARIDAINRKMRLENASRQKFKELDQAMTEYARYFGTQLSELPPKPKFSDYYEKPDNINLNIITTIIIIIIMIVAIVYLYFKRS